MPTRATAALAKFLALWMVHQLTEELAATIRQERLQQHQQQAVDMTE